LSRPALVVDDAPAGIEFQSATLLEQVAQSL
jgi:hypothetical protein